MIRKLMASSAVIALMSAGAIGIAQAQSDQAQPTITLDNATAAQDTAAAPATVADSSKPIEPEHPTLASTIIGRSVYSSTDPQSDNIGDVNDLIVDEKGEVTHAVIGVGGFLGIGEKNVAVPFDQLKVVEDKGDFRLVYSATKEQLESAQAFDRTAYDPAARGAPAATDTAANDTAGGTMPVSPGTTTDMAAAPPADTSSGDLTAAPASNMAAAPAPATEQTATAPTDASGATSGTSDQTAAGASTDTNAAAPANATAPAAADFVQTAATANLFEIESSKLARDHAQSDEVKTFADQMITDHTKAGDDLKAAVQSANANLTVPDAMDQTGKDNVSKLQSASADFDKQYVDMQVKAHDDAVKLFQGYADNGDNPSIKQFAQTTLPTLKHHQEMIHDIGDNLGSGANTAAAMPDDSQQTVAATTPATTADTAAPASDTTAAAVPNGELAIGVSPGQIRANTLMGQSVYGPDDANIGKVSDLVLQKEGGTRVALIDVGGFLGIGAKTVAIPFTDLKFQQVEGADANAAPQIAVAMTKEQLENLPAYDTSVLNTASTQPVDSTGAAAPQPDANGTMAAAPAEPSDNAPADTMTTGSISPTQDIAASKVIGSTVYGADDSTIGEVGDIVFDNKGDINAIVVDVGGFLGIGEKPVALNFDKLNMRADENGTLSFVVDATKDQLNSAPAFQAPAQ